MPPLTRTAYGGHDTLDKTAAWIRQDRPLSEDDQTRIPCADFFRAGLVRTQEVSCGRGACRCSRDTLRDNPGMLSSATPALGRVRLGLEFRPRLLLRLGLSSLREGNGDGLLLRLAGSLLGLDVLGDGLGGLARDEGHDVFLTGCRGFEWLA